MILTVSNKLGVTSTLELFAMARKDPGKLNYGSSGQGSTNHFATELLMDAADIKMTHIPYKGMSPAVTDVIAGNVDVLVASAPSIYAAGEGGQGARARRDERRAFDRGAGLATDRADGRAGIQLRALVGHPRAARRRRPRSCTQLNADVNRVLDTPEMKEAFLREGAEPAPMPPPQFAATISSEIDGWKKVAKRGQHQAGVSPWRS